MMLTDAYLLISCIHTQWEGRQNEPIDAILQIDQLPVHHEEEEDAHQQQQQQQQHKKNNKKKKDKDNVNAQGSEDSSP